jgi:hypothetical protein
MAGTAFIAGVEFGFPLIEQEQRCVAITGFVSEIVGDAAVGIDVEEMLAQTFGQKPGGDGKVLVMRASQALAIGVRFLLGRSTGGDGVFRGETAPDLIDSTHGNCVIG